MKKPEDTTDILSYIQQQPESFVTRRLVIPLLHKLYPESHVEETHGPLEAGRDVICFTRHVSLDIPYTICVQVKNHKISVGSTSGPYSLIAIKNQVEQAKSTGVVCVSGNRVLPDEIWVITAFPFTEPRRRQVHELLQEMQRTNTHLIDGNKLLSLIQKHIPGIAARVVPTTKGKVNKVIDRLMRHHEGRAFGLTFDRNVDEFFVNVRVCPAGALTRDLFSHRVKTVDMTLKTTVTLQECDEKSAMPLLYKRRGFELDSKGVEIAEDKYATDQQLSTIHSLVENYQTPLTVKVHKGEVIPNRGFKFRVTGVLKLSQLPNSYIHEIKVLSSKIPPKLGTTYTSIKRLSSAVVKAEQYLKLCRSLDRLVVGRQKANFTLKTTLISDESILPKLNSIVLVRGGPGIGKTTLLRRTAMQLLRRSRPAFFFNCAALKPEDIDKSMGYLVRKLATKGTPTDWQFKDSVLLVDGLDEVPFDLTAHLQETSGKFASVIVSVRSAFTTTFGPAATSLERYHFHLQRELYSSKNGSAASLKNLK